MRLEHLLSGDESFKVVSNEWDEALVCLDTPLASCTNESVFSNRESKEAEDTVMFRKHLERSPIAQLVRAPH